MKNEKVKSAEKQEQKRKQQERLKKAAALVAKFPEKKQLLAEYYSEEAVVIEENGLLFFAPDSRKEVVGAEKMCYDEYLEAQFLTLRQQQRMGFVKSFLYCPLEFKGQVEKIRKNYICFGRIWVLGMYLDGEVFEDKEDHVWIQKNGFEDFQVGESVSFHAEVYRYIKRKNGRQIDYGLRNPWEVQKIFSYQLPSEEELTMQETGRLRCEVCLYREQCWGICLYD